MSEYYDIAIVGAGMAGASLAAEVGGDASVLVLEAEHAPGYHATGRSAAFWEECYGGPQLVPLTLASGDYLREHGFLNRRGALYIGREQDMDALDAFMQRFAGTGATIERLERSSLARKIPGLRPDWTGAVWEPACADIDVAALHRHYLKRMAITGATLCLDARVSGLERAREGWTIHCADGREFRAGTIVNAAGSWADGLAELAGAQPLGIAPLRRTVVQLATRPTPPSNVPLVLDIAGHFYFKPQGGGVWLSPHDETPSEPCDAAPHELDVATAIDRFGRVVEWQVTGVLRKWAGLRSFAPDRLPVYGFNPNQAGFFWFAGQGGFGIQTAPAAARLGAQLLLGRGRDAMTAGLEAAIYAPGRF